MTEEEFQLLVAAVVLELTRAWQPRGLIESVNRQHAESRTARRAVAGPKGEPGSPGLTGGILPNLSVGPTWPSNSYKFSSLVAANPQAVLRDCYPADNGMPAGAVLPAILLCSGDSGNVTKSGKRIRALAVNGISRI